MEYGRVRRLLANLVLSHASYFRIRDTPCPFTASAQNLTCHMLLKYCIHNIIQSHPVVPRAKREDATDCKPFCCATRTTGLCSRICLPRYPLSDEMS
jgi:hypothetical protein